MSRSIHQLEQLRKLRCRPQPDLSISALIANTATEATKSHKKLGELIELWERLVPAELASQTSLLGLRAGVLQVRVGSSAASFELDRLLRSGLLAQLRQQFRGSLVRVKLQVGPLG